MWKTAILFSLLLAVGCKGSANHAQEADHSPRAERAAWKPVPPIVRLDSPVPAMTVELRERMLFDFETAAELPAWTPSYISKRPWLVQDKQLASSGTGALACDLDAGQTYPGIALKPARAEFDWSDGRELLFDARNPHDETFTLHMRIDSLDGHGKPLRCNRTFPLASGLNYLRLPLHAQNDLNPSRISLFLIFSMYPERTLRLYIDNMRLAMAPMVETTIDRVRMFDFGPPASQALPGFVGVSPGDILEAGKAFGFSSLPAHSGAAPHRLDSLTDDFIFTGNGKQAEFTVRLPQGRYEAAALVRGADSFDLPSLAWTISVNGRLKQKQGTSALTFYSEKGMYRGYEIDYGPDTDIWEEFVKEHVPFCRFEADTVDGCLRFTFDSCSVYGLMIWPAEHAAWGDRAIEQVQEMRRAEFYRFNYPTKLLRRPVRDVEQPVLAPVSYMRTVTIDYLPEPHDRVSTASAAPGEREPLAFALRTPIELKNLSARVSDLTGPNGTIPAAAVDLRLAKLFPVRDKGIYELLPVMLQPVAGQTIRPFVTRQFIADVHVPDGTAQGEYRGEISIHADGQQPLKAGIAVRVRGIKLPDDLPVGFAMFYVDTAAFKGHFLRLSGIERWEREIAAEFTNMRDYGLNAVSIARPRPTGMKDGRLVLDFSTADRVARLCRENGLHRQPALMFIIDYAESLMARGLEEFSPEYNTAFADACRQLVDWAKRRDLPLLFFVVDEPRERELNPWNRNLRDTLKYLEIVRSVPGARSYVPLMYDERDGTDYTALIEPLDVVATHPAKESRKLIARSGKKLAIYNGGRDRLSWGFYTWKSGAIERREWAYQWVNLPWNPLDPSNWTVAYWSTDGLLPTLEQVRMREGIDDYRYLHALEMQMAAAGKAGRDTTAAAALLEQIRKSVPEHLTAGTARFRDIEYELDAWRGRIAGQVEKLAN